MSPVVRLKQVLIELDPPPAITLFTPDARLPKPPPTVDEFPVASLD